MLHLHILQSFITRIVIITINIVKNYDLAVSVDKLYPKRKFNVDTYILCI